jgi:UDP-N-acetylmuramoyl-L-alanyl-D-glutamate--2,6-diaminopimelate ligase
MGKAGAELSDIAIVTSDNPRSEVPEKIIEEILTGIERGSGGNGSESSREGQIEVEVDRAKAIQLALGQASEGDTVVIAGKGHEQGQEFEDGRKIPFDDRDKAREMLRLLAGERW